MSELCFVDTSFLSEPTCPLAVEQLLSRFRPAFVFDSLVHLTLDRLKALDSDRYFVAKTMYDYLCQRKPVEIKADDFCEEKAIKEAVAGFKGRVIVLSQKASTFSAFSKFVGKAHELLFFDASEVGLRSRSLNERVERKPFGVPSDIYINKIKTDDIDYVFSPRFGYLRLSKGKIQSGGEGACYLSYRNLYCKIFNEEHLTYVNYKKLEHMLSMGIDNPHLAWPKDLLYYHGDFVGYAMAFVEGAKSITSLKDEGFSQYKHPLSRARICLSFLQTVKYLHDRNILVCDLKDDNVLVKSETDVYIIDCGSFQVDDFACDVVTKGWTDKAYSKGDLEKSLRSMDEEYYPINRLIFELMVLKNPFYSPKNLEIDTESSQFEFPLDVSGINRDSPPYLKLWAILTPRIREAFYYFFKDPGNRKITYIEEWIQEFEMLIRALE